MQRVNNQDQLNNLLNQMYSLEHDDARGWTLLSRHLLLTEEIIRDNMDLPWNFWEISANRTISWDFIEENADENWDWETIGDRHDITMDFILRNLHRNWRWSNLSSSPRITFYDILRNVDLPWDWEEVVTNPNVTEEMIESHMDLPWEFGVNVTENNNLSVDFVLRNSDRFDASVYELVISHYRDFEDTEEEHVPEQRDIIY